MESGDLVRFDKRTIRRQRSDLAVEPNLTDCDAVRASFSWDEATRPLNPRPLSGVLKPSVFRSTITGGMWRPAGS